MQIRENRRNVAEPRFLCDNSSKSILNTLKASQISESEGESENGEHLATIYS